jgi:hypothetical protein
MNKIEEALQSAIKAINEARNQIKELCDVHNTPYPITSLVRYNQAIKDCKSALSDIENSEVVAWQHREYPEKIYHNLGAFSSEYGNVHEAQPLFTSPQPIEKCEPVAEVKLDKYQLKYLHWYGNHWTQLLSAGTKLYTSPISKEWVTIDLSEYENQGLGAIAEEICEKLKALNYE